MPGSPASSRSPALTSKTMPSATTASPVARIGARFNGPPTTANGGYSCGVLGTLIGDAAEVTLRRPPPLDRELRIEREGSSGELRLLDGELLVATGRAAEPDVTPPAPPSAAVARASEFAYAGFDWHHFPTCFVCGTKRKEGDGLRLFTGKVPGRQLVASAWVPAPSVGTREGTVDHRVVWSALDCPTYFGGRLADYGRLAVLGRLTAKVLRPILVGAPHVVVGWPVGESGRKWDGGSAIFTAAGELCAVARGTWVQLTQLPPGA